MQSREQEVYWLLAAIIVMVLLFVTGAWLGGSQAVALFDKF